MLESLDLTPRPPLPTAGTAAAGGRGGDKFAARLTGATTAVIGSGGDAGSKTRPKRLLPPLPAVRFPPLGEGGWGGEVLALLLTIPAMLPLFAPGYFFNAHDARHSVYFLVEFDRAFRAGALWPIWGPDLAVGFGYPLWLIYAPLAYFVGQGFHLLGLGFVAATKATWALGFILGSLGVYRLARRWWGPAAGLIASVAFTYAPYHLVQIYVRAALAEFMALAWLPWVVLALVALWDAPGSRRAALAALAVAVLLMLHTVSMLTFVPLIAGLLLVLWLRDVRQQTIRVHRRSSASHLQADSQDAHIAGGVTTHEKRMNWTGGFSRLAYRRQKPAEASTPEPQQPVFRADGHAARGAMADENEAAVGGRQTADGRLRTARGAMADENEAAIGGRQTADGGRRSAVGGRQTADGRRRTAVSGRRSAVGGRQTADGRRRTAVSGRRSAVGIFRADGHAARRATADENEAAVGGRQTADGRLRTAVGGRRSAVGIFRAAAHPYGGPRWLKAAAWTVAAAALGGLLASIFLIPMLLERGNIVESQWVSATYNYRNHFVYPLQFIDPAWGFGYSVPGPDDGMSFQLGLAIIPLALAGAIAALRRRPAGLPHRAAALFLVLASIVALFMMTPAATVLWDALPLVEMIQFPWRLLAVTAFTLALLAGGAAHWLEQRTRPGRPRRFVVGGLALAILLMSLPYVRADLVPVQPWRESPLAIFDFEMNFKDMRGMTRWSERQPQDADSPLIAQYLAGEAIRRAAIVSGQGDIIEQEAGALHASATVRAETPVRLRFYTYYFPGWRGAVDGQPVELAPDPPNGLIGLDLPAGEHRVAVRFGATPVRTAAAGLSVLGLGIALVLIWGRKQNASLQKARSIP